ncbi:MAG: cytochrome C oxidase Cbb3 [Nitrospira bacterium SG8_35_4]|nr:MAG: cytochrome C oxidase Cbb3 [Nitrospira bacterium SG8_35_4]
MWTIFFLIFIALITGIVSWLLFLWAVKSGQFNDLEGPKYRMLDDDDIGNNKNK